MDATEGMRFLRALSADADRDQVADVLAKACLRFNGVERAEVVFFLDDGSVPFPSSISSALMEARTPVALASEDGSGQRHELLVPLIVGDDVLGALKIESSTFTALDADLTNAFEHLAAYAALRIEKASVDAELRRFQERARLAEWELRLSWDTLPAHAWHTSPDGRLEDVNRQWLSYFGLTKEESMGFGYMRVFHPDDRERVQDVWTRLLTNEIAGGVEARMVGRDGASRTFLLRAVPIRDESGKVIKWYGLNTDVEDLKEAQREIARTAAALAEGQKLSRTGTWSWRPATDVFEWSEECARIFGFTEKDGAPTFATMVERAHPEDRASTQPLEAAIASAARDAYAERRVVRPDGTVVFVESRSRAVRDAAGEIVEFVGTVRDLTEWKAVQDRIHESERRFAATLSSIGDAVISTDDRGRLTFINPVGEKLTGWTLPEAAERPVGEVFRLIDETRGSVDDPVAEILGHEVDPATGIQYVLRARSGSDLTIDVSGAPIIDGRGEMKGAVLVFRDMTQRNETTEALQKLKEDLARMSRLTAIGELAVSVAHEMNQPLMAIVTNAAAAMSWLKSGSPNIEEAVQAIDWVLRDGHRAGEVLSGILALARNSRPKVGPLSIRSVIEEVQLLTKSELRQKGVVVETRYDGEVDSVNGDRIQLQQVLINLVMNGAEAMATIEGERKVLQIVLSGRNSSIEVSVSDNGVGLDPDTADRAFEAFFTTKATGIGMGLSICRSIIEAHGGHIWVTTKKGTGSTFSFTLPPLPSSQERSATPEE